MITISGGIFNFSVGGYSPPTWSGATYNFGVALLDVYQIYTDEYHVYVASNNGIGIYDIETERVYAHILYDGYFTSVYGNDDKVFFGTNNYGVKYINKTCVSGSIDSPYSLSTCLLDYLSSPDITSNKIRYIHCNNDYIGIVTNSGIDFVKLNPQINISSTTVTSGNKCFVTSNGNLYYTLSGTNGYSINKINICLCDWSIPDVVYNSFDNKQINDIFITEDTSSNNTNNTVFAATNSGVYVVDEESSQIRNDYVLISGSENVIAIWADEDSGLYSGKFYAASNNVLNVVDIDNNELYDWYSQSHVGRANESLDSNDIVDINVLR
jgi:hypothetical protein